MRRREFIVLSAGALIAWSPTTDAQQAGQRRRIGVLAVQAESDPEARSWIAAFTARLGELGWKAGESAWIDYRWGGGDPKRLAPLAKELIELKPDAILAATNSAAVALRLYTLSIPIVFTQVGDPVAAGLVSNLARPEGNITGFNSFEYGIASKWIGALKECVPGPRRAAILFDPGNPAWPLYVRAIEGVASSLGVRPFSLPVTNDEEIERALTGFATEPNGGVILIPSPSTILHRAGIITTAARYHLPVIYPYRFFAAEGGLISYGTDLTNQYRQAASYVDRLLKGEKPADLPVQQPTKFDLVINLKTAREIGLVIPQTLLATADEVIQ
jgi:putative ABC transport system substrate-binding protein